MNTLSMTDLIRNQVTAIQAKCDKILDFAIGKVMRAIVESNSSVAVWLESLVLQVLATTRASTSSGDDLDSWVEDFGVTRTAAVAATGSVTFSRFTSTLAATIPVGTQVQTEDGDQVFSVIADTSNAYYDSTTEAYIVPAGTSAVTVLVQADEAGADGNVLSNTITSMVSAISAIDTVTNAYAFTNGIDEESDDNLRTRFVEYILSLARGTEDAIGFAITSVQSGLTYTITENETYAGVTDYGYFYVVVDDGTGTPSATLLASISNAIDSYRALTIRFGVFAPVVNDVTIALTTEIATGYTAATEKALVQAAIDSYVNSLALGATLYLSRLTQIALDASDGIVNISGLTVDGATADIVAGAKQIIKSSSITVN